MSEMYHVSPSRNRDAIMRDGLRQSDVDDTHVWLFPGLDAAQAMATRLWNGSRQNDIWRVDTNGLNVVPDPHGWEHGRAVTQPIEPGRVALHTAADVDPEYWPLTERLKNGYLAGALPERVASILDPIHSTLDVRVFDDPAADEPTLKPELQQWIPQVIFEALERHGYDQPGDWGTLVFTGSLTTYQYADSSDADVSLFVDAEKLPDWSRAEMIGIMVSDFDNVNLPGTPHPLQAYVVPADLKPEDLYKPGLRSGYVVYGQKAGTWIVPPDRNRVHDVETEMNDAYTVGLLASDKLDLLLRYEPDRAREYWETLHQKRRQEAAAGMGDAATSNIVWKMIVNRFGEHPVPA